MGKRIQLDLSDPGRLWGRLARRIVTSPGCWTWVGKHGTKGYAMVSCPTLDDKRPHQSVPVHRLLFLLANPDTPLDHDIHHKCHHPWCVNPFDVEDKTISEHRKEHPRRVQNPQREFCLRGHPLSGYNLAVVSGKRRCRLCMSIRDKKSRRAKSTFHRGEHKTHCKHGHPWVPENIYTKPATGHRECRLCIRDRAKRLAARASQ